jgi:hypothetical protein
MAWWLPDLESGDPPADDPYFMLSTDAQRPPARAADGPSGPWIQYYPVKILQSGPFTEAVMMCACRDFNHPGFDTLWRFMLNNLVERNSCKKEVGSEF